MIEKKYLKLYRDYFQRTIKNSFREHLIYLVLSIPVIFIGVFFSLFGILVFLGFSDLFMNLAIMNTIGLEVFLPLATIDGDPTSTTDFYKAFLLIFSFGPLLVFYACKGFIVNLWLFLKLLMQRGLFTVTDQEAQAIEIILKESPVKIENILIDQSVKNNVIDLLKLIHFIAIHEDKVYQIKDLPKVRKTTRGIILVKRFW